MGCPKSLMWKSEGEAWSEDESVSSSGSHEGNVGKISLFLKDGSWQRWSWVPAWPWTCCELGVMLPRGLLSRHECSPLTVDGP